LNIPGFVPVNETSSYIKMLLYGTPGAGKTRFCADAPNPIWFDYESSTETLKHTPGYEHIPVKKTRNIEQLLADVQAAVKAPDVDTVVIDTITSCHDYYLRKHVAKAVKDSGGRRSDPNVLYEGDYKYVTQVFTNIFGELQDANINVVLIGHQNFARDNESGQITSIWPDITPRLRGAVTRLVNVVGYLEMTSNLRGAERKLYLNQTPIIEAKNRLNIQQQSLQNPTWKDLYK
jgi:phage nucleotide-binding protein